MKIISRFLNFCYLILILNIILLGNSNYLYSEEIQLTFFNIKEGDAIFLETSARKILIDAGPPIIQKSIIEKLNGLSISVILTHPHPDHYGGLFYLQGVSLIESIYDNGEALDRMSEGADYAYWYNQIVRSHDKYKRLEKGEIPFFEKNFKLEVLWPNSITKDRDLNENSLVLLLTAYKKKVLLMGDATQSVEKALLKEGMLDLNIDILKVAHHGAADACSEEFLEKIKPKFSIIMGSGNERYHYLNSAVLERLRKYSQKVFITDQDGSVVYKINERGDNLIVEN